MEQEDTNIWDCEYVEYKDSTVLIQKVISLFEEQITKKEFQRHKEHIYQFVVVCQNGFFMKDLDDLMILMELLLQRIDEVEEYPECFEEILQICAIPPRMSLSSDILTYAKPFKEYFRMLGHAIVCLKDAHLQALAADALLNLLTRQIQDRHYVSLERRINYIIDSRLPEILGHLLEFAEENIYLSLLNMIFILAKNSEKVCHIIVRQDAINSLLARLEPTWRTRYPNKPPPSVPIENVLHYDESIIIVLMLLKYLSENEDELKNVKSVTLFSLWSLQYTFRYFARTNHHLNRNNVLIIVLKMIVLFPDLDFVTSGLAKDLTHIGLNTAYSLPWAKDVRLSTDDDDCLYMKILIASIPLYMKYYGGIRVLEEQRVLHKLLAITRNKYTIKWKHQEACVLSRVALNTLMDIVPYTEEEFIESGGSIILLGIVKSYKSKETDMNILYKCLQAILHIIRNTVMVVNSIIFNNGVNLILDLCEDLVFNLFEDAMGKKCLTLIFFILDDLYAHSTEKDKKVITMAITYMKTIVQRHREMSMRDTREIIAVMNFVWEHIIKNESYAKEFVDKGGVYLMLDMVQKFPFVVQMVTLGALVDLCEFGQCIPYLITWKRNGQKLLPMLMKLFREENKQLKVKMGPYGQIIDIRYPLMGKDQWFLTFCTCKPLVHGHACVSDLYVSCRPKIYALLQMLEVRHADKVQIANEHYRSNDDELKPGDQITRLLAENFMALKLGEAWVELKEEFDRLGIPLTALDYKLLTCLTSRTNKFAKHLKTIQKDIVLSTKEKEQIKEYTLYKHVQDGKLIEALEALSELKAIARCSEHMFRIASKYKQQIQIDDTLLEHPVKAHRTYFSGIRVTPVFNQIISTEKVTYSTMDEATLVPVSPIESRNVCDVDIPEDLLQSSTEDSMTCQE